MSRGDSCNNLIINYIRSLSYQCSRFFDKSGFYYSTIPSDCYNFPKDDEKKIILYYRTFDEDNERKYDVIVANILAKPLIGLSSYFSKKLKDDGLICVSGILAPQTDEIRRAYESVANFSVCNQEGDWVMLAGIKSCI